MLVMIPFDSVIKYLLFVKEKAVSIKTLLWN